MKHCSLDGQLKRASERESLSGHRIISYTVPCASETNTFKSHAIFLVLV